MGKIEQEVYENYIVEGKNIVETAETVGITISQTRDIIIKNRMKKGIENEYVDIYE